MYNMEMEIMEIKKPRVIFFSNILINNFNKKIFIINKKILIKFIKFN